MTLSAAILCQQSVNPVNKAGMCGKSISYIRSLVFLKVVGSLPALSGHALDCLFPLTRPIALSADVILKFI